MLLASGPSAATTKSNTAEWVAPEIGVRPPVFTLTTVRMVAPAPAAPPTSPAMAFPMPWPNSSRLLSWKDEGMESDTRDVSSESMAPRSASARLVTIIDGSMLTSLVSDSMTSSFHDSNRELFGQGIGNAIAGLFGGAAGAGATMRTVVNVKTGGRTPISGATHSAVLLFVVAALGPLASNIPTACLAGILIKSGLDVVDWNLLKRIDKIPVAEAAIMFTTFVLTVFVDLILAVVVGWLMGIFLFFYRSTEMQLSPQGLEVFDDPSSAKGYIKEYLESHGAGDASVVKLKGMVTFVVAVSMMRKLVPTVVGKKKVMIDLSDVKMIDASAVLSIEELLQKIKAAGGETYVCGADSCMDGVDLLTGLDIAQGAINQSVMDDPKGAVA